MNLPPEVLFNVVADVGQYKKFLKWCTRSEVVRQPQVRHSFPLSVFGVCIDH